MMRFKKVRKPRKFKAAESKGAAWLATAPAKGRPKDLWSPFKKHLADGFGDLCGYSAMYEPVGTVDHFVSCDEDRAQAYKWSNYRYCAAWFNSSKSKLKSTQVLDPFTVKDDWFEILLPSLELVATGALPKALANRAKTMLKRLGHDERVMRQRRSWHKQFEDKEIDLTGLARRAPLIARAIEKQQKLKKQQAQKNKQGKTRAPAP